MSRPSCVRLAGQTSDYNSTHNVYYVKSDTMLAFFGHLLDRFDLGLFGVTLTTHGTSYLGRMMKLGGVYETRGDSRYMSHCNLNSMP